MHFRKRLVNSEQIHTYTVPFFTGATRRCPSKAQIRSSWVRLWYGLKFITTPIRIIIQYYTRLSRSMEIRRFNFILAKLTRRYILLIIVFETATTRSYKIIVGTYYILLSSIVDTGHNNILQGNKIILL